MKKEIDFDTTKIWFGLKKRFLQISDNDFFCFYDGFGSWEGKIFQLKNSPDITFSDYKNATVQDVNDNMCSLQEDMYKYRKRIGAKVKRTRK